MGKLERIGSGAQIFLRSRHLVGRSRLAHLRLAESRVSGEHAVIVWTGTQWELHDLGSRNGTFVDGRRVDTGGRVALAQSMQLGFGQPEAVVAVVDAEPPRALAVADTESALGAEAPDVRVATAGILALPGEDEPELMVYRAPDGEWVADDQGERARVRDGAQIAVGGRRYTLVLPEPLAPTWQAQDAAPTVDAVELRLQVSGDEEYVTAALAHGDRIIDLGNRAHHYLLLTLARARLRDRETGVSEGECGWVYQEELGRMLDMDDKHINVAIFRLRAQVGGCGVDDAGALIERRKPTRQLRLGVSRSRIERM